MKEKQVVEKFKHKMKVVFVFVLIVIVVLIEKMVKLQSFDDGDDNHDDKVGDYQFSQVLVQLVGLQQEESQKRQRELAEDIALKVATSTRFFS